MTIHMENCKQDRLRYVLVVLVFFILSGCLPKDLATQLGGGSTTVAGSADSAGDSTGQQVQLTQCSKPYGTIAMAEPETLINAEAVDKAPDPRPMLKLIMAQSRCFQVLDRGYALKALQQERSLSASGELAQNVEKGQLARADYILTPHIVFSDSSAGGAGIGGILGALMPGVLGVIAGSLNINNLEAQTLLTLTNVTTGVQESIAEGRATKSDLGFGIGGLLAGGNVGAGAAGGVYKNTDMNKIVVAAFLDAHNKLVNQMER